MQLAADERRPKSLLRLLKAEVSSLSARTVVERECGSRSGANAPNNCECAGVGFIYENGADQTCVFGCRQSISGENHNVRSHVDVVTVG